MEEVLECHLQGSANRFLPKPNRHKLIAVVGESVSSPCLHPSPFHINTDIAALLGFVHIQLMLPGMEYGCLPAHGALAVPVSLF